MNDKNQTPSYYDGSGLKNIRVLNRNNRKEFVIKPKIEGKEITFLRFPYFPYLEK